MKIEQIKEEVIRAEGYAEGFRAGFIACAQKLINEVIKVQKIEPIKEEDK